MRHRTTQSSTRLGSALLACTITLVILGCGGESDGPNASACAANVTAPIDSSVAELQPVYGGKKLTGRLCLPQCIQRTELDMYANASGWSWGTNLYSFSITSVCKNPNSPNVYYVSGSWNDGTLVTNAPFTAAGTVATLSPLPAAFGSARLQSLSVQ